MQEFLFKVTNGFCQVASYSSGMIIKAADPGLFALAPAGTNQSMVAPRLQN